MCQLGYITILNLNTDMDSNQQEQTPKPADLQSLEKLIGSWAITGEAQGHSTYEWAEGGFFIIQHLDFVQADKRMHGMEFIGHEKKLNQAPSPDIKTSLYNFADGMIWNYTYELIGNNLTIWAGDRDSPAYFKGTFSADDKRYSGKWIYPGGGYEMTATRT